MNNEIGFCEEGAGVVYNPNEDQLYILQKLESDNNFRLWFSDCGFYQIDNNRTNAHLLWGCEVVGVL